MGMQILDGSSSKTKIFRERDYNYNFNLQNGYFERYGLTKEDDPDFSAYGPELADIEITEICAGGCPYCYKSNTPTGKNMSFTDFQKVIGQLNVNGQLTQVAFGLGMTGEENPELWDMCKWLRANDIIPNGTVANISDETAKKIADNFGACAVSAHTHWDGWLDILGDSIARLTKHSGPDFQINIHFVLAQETDNDLFDLFTAAKNDPRFAKLNAIVLLGIKKCGRAAAGDFHPVSQERFAYITEYALGHSIGIGFDSCSSHKFTKFVEDKIDFVKGMKVRKGWTEEMTQDSISKLKTYLQLAEPCESLLFSQYINVEGKAFPCSFNETTEPGFDVVNCKDFLTQYWNATDSNNNWRCRLLQNKRHCPTYKI
jgi:hypothetical protein